MTLKEILSLPTEDLEKLTEPELMTLLGPLVPMARAADRDRAQVRDTKQLIEHARKVLAQ